MALYTTITANRRRAGGGAVAAMLLLAGIAVPAAGQVTNPAPGPASAPAASGSDLIREADCRFLADNFKNLEAALSTVDFASTRANMLADLHTSIARLHRRRGCPSRQLVAAFTAAMAARSSMPSTAAATGSGKTFDTPAAESAGETTMAAVPDPAVIAGRGPRRDRLAAGSADAVLPPPPKPPVPPTAGPRQAKATADDRDRRPKMDDLIVTARVPVRIRPDDAADILGVLEEGSLVPLASPVPEKGWLRMDVGEGRVGFVPAAVVSTRAAALETLRRRVHSAAEEGDPEAQFQAGNIAVRTDIDTAVAWWHKAADAGHPGALYNLGVAYVDGSIQPTNSARAVALWREAAQKDHPKAQQALAKAERLLRRTRRPVTPQASPATATEPVAPAAATAIQTPTPDVEPAPLDTASSESDPPAVDRSDPAPMGDVADGPDDPILPTGPARPAGGTRASGSTSLPPPPGVLPNE